MKEQVKSLTNSEVDFMRTVLGDHVYNSSTQIIYRGQVPMAAYILIEGVIELRDSQKKVVETLTGHHLIGFKEICLNKPFRFTAEIQAGSKVLILDRSSIQQIKEIFQEKSPKESFVTEKLLTSIA